MIQSDEDADARGASSDGEDGTYAGTTFREAALEYARDAFDQLPASMATCGDYERFAECALSTNRLVDCAYHAAVGTGSGSMELSAAEADELASAMDSAIERFSEFWFAHSVEMCDEEKLTKGDLPASWRSAPQISACTYFLACVSRCALGCVARPGAGEELMSRDALSFPGVANQSLAQFSKPILEYTASELLWALDSLAKQWYAIVHEADVAGYVSLLALRYGMFLRCASRPEEFGSDRLHTIPAPGSRWCAPSRMFRDLATGRLAAFVGAGWRLSVHEQSDSDSFGSAVRASADAMDSAVSMFSDDARRSPRVARPLDPAFGALQVAELLLRYATESATSETFRETFSKMAVECAICPGDMDAFAARHRFMSRTPANAIKQLRGDRYSKEVFRKARVVGPEPFLRSAVERMRSGKMSATFDEQIAALCLLDALCKNRYAFGWYDEFFVTGYNHQALVAGGTVPTARDIPSLRADALHARLPRVAMLCNTFDVIFEGRLRKTGNAFESIAWWLEILGSVYGGRIPDPTRPAAAVPPSAPSSSSGSDREAGPTRQRRRRMAEKAVPMGFRDIGPLCDVVRKGHRSFVVRSRGEEAAQFGTIRMGGVAVSVIDDGM